MCDNSQSLGEFFVLQDGGIVPDFGVARRRYMVVDDGSPFMDHVPPCVTHVACFWEHQGKVRTCVTDRNYNNIEVDGVSITRVVQAMDSLLAPHRVA